MKVPYRIKRLMPPRMINLLCPPPSPVLELPYCEFQADKLTGLGRTTIIVPHPDDETLGCGGLIALLARSGCAVNVLFVCNGDGSHPNSKTHSPLTLAAIRREEALAALETLGVERSNVLFMGIADGCAPFPNDEGFEGVVDRMTSILRGLESNSIFIPWRRDHSRDHQAVAQIAIHAIDRVQDIQNVYEYPVWSWVRDGDVPRPDEAKVWRLNVSSAIGLKRRAIRCHQTQLGKVIRDDAERFVLDNVFLSYFNLPWEYYFQLR